MDEKVNFTRIFESGLTAGNATETATTTSKKVTAVAVKTEKDVEATSSLEDSVPSMEGLFGKFNSLVFLSGTGKSNKIKSGDSMSMIEITEKTWEDESSIMTVEFEDFQWICPTDQFQKYLKTTGRSEKDWDTNEKENAETNFSRVLNYDEYSEEKIEEEKILSFSDYMAEEKIDESGIEDMLMPSVTERGMKYQKGSPDFSGGKLSDDDRKFLKFYYTKNAFMYGSKKSDFNETLDLEKLSVGEIIQIFACYIDPSNPNEVYESSTVALNFKAKHIAKPTSPDGKYLVIGHIQSIAPATAGSNYTSSFAAIMGAFDWAMDAFESVWSSVTGKLVLLGAAAYTVLPLAIKGFVGYKIFKNLAGFRNLASELKAIRTGTTSVAKASKIMGAFRAIKGRVGNFIFYPGRVLKSGYGVAKNIAMLVQWNKISRGTQDVLRGRKALRFVLYGTEAAKVASKASKLARIGTGIAKWSNPLGWILLATDAIVSTINYTSDNQAPSWDPIVGGESDGLVNYKKECPDAKNSVKFKDLEVGKQYTMCWTQGPEGGFKVALSFVASVSTRTTIDMVKLCDVGEGTESISIFAITMINYKKIWDEIKGADIKLIAFKAEEEYSEGYADSNITAKLIMISNPTDPKDMLPVRFLGHTNPATFTSVYSQAPDQLVSVGTEGPDEYMFNFEDSEGNIINVWGRKITSEDLENVSESEMLGFFKKTPESSYIGDPSKETEEERNEREKIEEEARKKEEEESKEEEKKSEDGEESEENLASTNESVLSFEGFKRMKNGDFVNEGGLEVLKDKQATNPNEELEKIIKELDGPLFFEVYFVTLREYADPSLRNTYKPGSFTNFLLNPEAISASDGSIITDDVSINNYDLLYNVKKGTYTFNEKDKVSREEEIELGKSQIDVKSYQKGEIFDLSRTPEKEKEEKKEELEKEGGLISKIDKEDQQKLDVSNWDDITNVKVVRDAKGNVEKVKIRNRKAEIGDKGRDFKPGDPGFDSALRTYNKYQEYELEKSKDQSKKGKTSPRFQ